MKGKIKRETEVEIVECEENEMQKRLIDYSIEKPWKLVRFSERGEQNEEILYDCQLCKRIVKNSECKKCWATNKKETHSEIVDCHRRCQELNIGFLPGVTINAIEEIEAYNIRKGIIPIRGGFDGLCVGRGK